jgi:hypothetical protein
MLLATICYILATLMGTLDEVPRGEGPTKCNNLIGQ